MDKPSKHPLPTSSTPKDLGAVIAKGAVSAIPFAGGAISEIIGAAVSLPLSKRRDEWFQDLASRLEELEGQKAGFSLDSLGDNEQFVSAAVQATQAALRTHQKEKIEALRNAVLNTAVRQGPEDDYQTVFFALIDRFTPAHLRLLKSFHDPLVTKGSNEYLRWLAEGLEQKNKLWRGLPRWVRDHVPGFRDSSQQFIQILISDLNNAGLTTAAEAEESPHSPTEFGRLFLKFIHSPLGK